MNFIEYVKQIWKNGPGGGTPWSAARLNHMEDGIKNNNSMISELNNNITHNTCVNLLNPSFHSLTQNGLTINNDNGVYTINGTCSETTVFTLQSNIEIASGKYKLTGCPQGGSTTSFKLDFEYKGNSIGADYGNGSIINKTSNDTFKYLRIVVYTGAILNNAVFKPMLTTDLSALYDDYVSYTGNTGRLNADVALLKNNLNKVLVSYYKSEPTLTLKKGTYWIFINKTQYSQSSIWAISSNQQPVAVANPSNEQMSMELNNDIMTITWKNASYAAVSVLKVY